MIRKDPKKRPEAGRVIVPLSMSGELEAKIVSAAAQVKLSKQDTMRLAVDRGLDVLIAQLTTAPQPA